jgi:hypothetical protein
VTLWRRGDVNYVRLDLVKEILDFREAGRHIVPLPKLPGHQFFSVAHANDCATREMRDLLRMLIGYLAASDE